MRALKNNYIAILRIELNDLLTDLEKLIEECSKGHQTGMISENVLMQNLAVFKNEILGVHRFQRILDNIHAQEYERLDDMIEDIRLKFHALIHDHGLADAIQIYIDRKLLKVERYVKQ